eukprot:TRINITY_DN5448_c0_g1_i1.p1 TRINITY_DN5448_c0_g1~~TRINITY_DN5448_c0_g1_i1.p1  ORF type:complete len:328 (+),score=44.94 TRINITY_DN5448_c0_g1_i1:33-1016(+)
MILKALSGEAVLSAARSSVPALKGRMHKGQCGRVGVVGGSLEYTGAPFFATISALYSGADLGYVFCTKSAATPIKSYSPELIVLPLLRTTEELEPERSVDTVADAVSERFSALHALVVGPGLGRDRIVMSSVSQLIIKARNLELPIVVDGDGLWLISQEPELIKGYTRAILTPNAVEYSRLCARLLGTEVQPNSETQEAALERTASLATALGNVTVLRKGEFDVISDGLSSVVCTTPGGLRRCSGQGDILAGTVGLFSAWTHVSSENTHTISATVSAAFAGCVLTRTCSRVAFQKHHRSVTTTKLIEHISECFDSIFELESVKREFA